MAHRYTAFKKINKPGRYSIENTINDITPELNKGRGLEVQPSDQACSIEHWFYLQGHLSFLFSQI